MTILIWSFIVSDPDPSKEVFHQCFWFSILVVCAYFGFFGFAPVVCSSSVVVGVGALESSTCYCFGSWAASVLRLDVDERFLVLQLVFVASWMLSLGLYSDLGVSWWLGSGAVLGVQ